MGFGNRLSLLKIQTLLYINRGVANSGEVTFNFCFLVQVLGLVKNIFRSEGGKGGSLWIMGRKVSIEN